MLTEEFRQPVAFECKFVCFSCFFFYFFNLFHIQLLTDFFTYTSLSTDVDEEGERIAVKNDNDLVEMMTMV